MQRGDAIAIAMFNSFGAFLNEIILVTFTGDPDLADISAQLESEPNSEASSTSASHRFRIHSNYQKLLLADTDSTTLATQVARALKTKFGGSDAAYTVEKVISSKTIHLVTPNLH